MTGVAGAPLTHVALTGFPHVALTGVALAALTTAALTAVALAALTAVDPPVHGQAELVPLDVLSDGGKAQGVSGVDYWALEPPGSCFVLFFK